MAAPVERDQELELQIDSLAFGGNGVARLNGFVVFVRRGLPGDRVRARVTKVKRNHAEALATEVLEPARTASRRPASTTPRAAAAGSRTSPTRCRCRPSTTRLRTRSVGSAASPRRLEPIVPAKSVFQYRNKLEYSFTQYRRSDARLPQGGRWDEVLEIEQCWLTTDLGNAVRNAVRDWAREEGLEAYDQETQQGYLRHLVYREGRNTGQVLALLVTAPGEKFETGYFVEVLRKFPEVRSVHWAINDTPAEVTNLPTRLLWGEDAIEEELGGSASASRRTRSCRRTPRWPRLLYGLAREYAG